LAAIGTIGLKPALITGRYRRHFMGGWAEC